MQDKLNQKELLQQFLVPASNGTRFLNLIIDAIAFRLILFGTFFILGIISTVLGYTEWIESIANINPIADYFLTAFLLVCYYIFFEGLFGRSIGKMITKTRVITTRGETATFEQILGRSFARLIPFDALSFLGDGNGWHDSMSGTMVIKENNFYQLWLEKQKESEEEKESIIEEGF